jgi:hypothetical protein
MKSEDLFPLSYIVRRAKMAKIFSKTIIMSIIPMVIACTVLFAGATPDVGGEKYSIISADQSDPFATVIGELLCEEEMDTITGNLWIKGWRLKKRQKRQSYKQKSSDTSKAHCDILAQNKLDDMGYETANQDGTTTNYDSTLVKDIYTNGFPNNRHEEPPVGGGYIFSTENEEKEHMQVYVRKPGSTTYERHWNDSMENKTPMTYEPDRLPPRTTSQRFVPLKKMSFFKRYYR